MTLLFSPLGVSWQVPLSSMWLSAITVDGEAAATAEERPTCASPLMMLFALVAPLMEVR